MWGTAKNLVLKNAEKQTVKNAENENKGPQKKMWGAAKKLALKSIEKEPPLNVDDEEINSQVPEEEEEEKHIESAKGKGLSLFSLVSGFTKDKFRKKAHDSDHSGSPRSHGETPKSFDEERNELEQLTVRDEDLLALRESIEKLLQHEKVIKTEGKSYNVRRPKPPDDRKKVTKKIVVARPARPDAQLKDVVPSGPRYSDTGEIIPHSIVGSVQDFIDEALKRQEIRADSPAVISAPKEQGKLEVKKYERPFTQMPDYIPIAMNQQNALRNWRRKMAERKKIQGNISNLLDKPLDRLVMNHGDKMREIQERKTILDRTIPAVDYGKGYRVGSEFWKQSESIGDDLTGIKMAVTKTERGSPVIFEHIGKPVTIQHEVGETWQGDRITHDARKTWFSSKYLRKRMRQLEPLMNELDPHKPDIPNLEIVGNDDTDRIQVHEKEKQRHPEDRIVQNGIDPLSKYPDVVPGPIMRPGLLFNGKPIYWTGPETENENKIAVETRVTFECVASQRGASHIEIENIGTTAVFYGWKKIPQVLSFDVLKPNTVQRFYFNTGDGFILPGDKITLPFVFKSPNAGIFSEKWRFITRPSLMSGSSVQIVLRGVAEEDEQSNFVENEKIDRELRAKEALFDVQQIISEIIRGIRIRERAPTPIDSYLTEAEIFERKNPGKYYDHDTVVELKNLYLQLFGEDDREGREWDLSLDELQSCITAVTDEEAEEELLVGLNKIITRLSFPPLTPLQREMYASAYKSWQDTIDKIVGCSMHTRSLMGLPEVTMVEPTPDADADDKKGKGKKGNSKEDKGKKGKGGKDAKDSRPKSKDPKGKGGKGSTHTPTKDLQTNDRDEVKTPSTAQTAPTDSMEPKTRKMYSEKMYSQVYEILAEMIDHMALSFEEVKSKASQP